MLGDLKYALRQLRKSPGFAITAFLTLAIGIGANTAMFSIMDALVLRPLAVPDMNRVMTVDEQQGNGNYQQVALANYEDWQRQSRSFEDLAVYRVDQESLTGSGDAAQVVTASTSANFFSVLRTQPLIGRLFSDPECQTGKDDVALLSYGAWQRRFGGDATVLGRKVELDGRAFNVIGVMPRAVQYPSTADFFLPLAPTPQQRENRISHDYVVFGRLRSGVSVKQAQAETAAIAARLEKAYPLTNLGWSVHVEPLLDGINGAYTNSYITMIVGATLFVLLVVCANIANLQFARGVARRPEIAMRTALGAGRGQILRQLLTENIVIALAGAAGGVLIAVLDVHISTATLPQRVSRYMAGWTHISINGHVLVYSLLLAVAAGVLAGIMPAFEALRVNLIDQLKSGSRTTSGSRRTHWLRNSFAAAQIALAVALVVGAALISRGTWATLHFGDRFQPNRILLFEVHLPAARYDTPEKLAAFYDASLTKLRALPGVQHADIASSLPWGSGGWQDDFQIEHRPVVPGKFQSAVRMKVTSEYFDALHIPVQVGRSFNSSDGLATLPVAVVSRAFVQRYFPGENPIGHRIRLGVARGGAEPWTTIVGVSGDSDYEWGDQTATPAIALDATQSPDNEARFVVATAGDPLALAPATRRALASIDPTVPVDAQESYQQYLSEAFSGLSYAEGTLVFDAFIALLLAAIGIFGVMANLVAERVREIGLRLAIGAEPRDVLRMILRRAAVLTSAGLGVGLVLAAGLARLVASLLVGVRPDDPRIFGGITVAVIAVALVASWIPARHAAHIDPMQALRDE
jgi:putative ABC transport system permease protein